MRITCPTLKYWFNDIFYIKGLNSSNFLCWKREKYCKIATTTEFLHLQIYIFESDKFIYTSTCSYSLLTKVKQNHEDVDKGLSGHYIPRLWQDWLHMILDTNNLQVCCYLNPPPRGLLPNPPPCLIGCPNPPRPRPEIHQSLINDYIHTWHSKYIFKVTWHELFSLFWWFL